MLCPKERKVGLLEYEDIAKLKIEPELDGGKVDISC